MKRINFLLLLLITIIGLNNVSSISAQEAGCSAVPEQFVDKTSYDGGPFLRLEGGISLYDIKHNQTVCGVFSYWNNGKQLHTAQRIRCVNGQQKQETCGGEKICVSNHEQNGNSHADCIDYKLGYDGCDSGSLKYKTYYENNTAKEIWWDKFQVDNDKACFGNTIRRCEKITGIWVDTEETCKDDSPCIMVKSGGSPMEAHCSGCTNPNKPLNYLYCNEQKQTISKCLQSGWTEYSIGLIFGSDCKRCYEDASKGATCLDENTELCYKIENVANFSQKGSPGTKVCNPDQNHLYICDSQDIGFKNGFFKSKEECFKNTDGRVKCGAKKGSNTLECITEAEFGDNPQNYIDITTFNNDAYFCDNKKGINTAIGCIPITVDELVKKLLPNLFGIAGGIAFLMMVYGFIMVSTSSGDEKKAQEAQKIITSAITGLLVAIFALFLYKLIAVDILHIPGIN